MHPNVFRFFTIVNVLIACIFLNFPFLSGNHRLSPSCSVSQCNLEVRNSSKLYTSKFSTNLRLILLLGVGAKDRIWYLVDQKPSITASKETVFDFLKLWSVVRRIRRLPVNGFDYVLGLSSETIQKERVTLKPTS